LLMIRQSFYETPLTDHWSDGTRMYAMMWWHPIILVLIANVRAGLFESRHILANARWVTSCFSSAS
jgi:hypothetical protein